MNNFGRRIYVFVLVCLMYFPHDVAPYYQYPSVYWAPKNCRFNLNKPPDSAYEFRVKPFGKLYFVCPNIALWNDMSSIGPQLSMMHENLILVDKEGYETCTVNKTRDPRLNRVILKCDGDASQLKYMQETFSRFRAGQHRMQYESGKTYYFISTSNGSKESLDNLSGGHCRTHNMKLKITVCDTKDSCEFKMPKCPFTDVSQKTTTTTTTTTTQAPTTQTTLPKNTGTEAAAVNNPKPTFHKETITIKTEEKKVRKQILIRPTDALVTDSPTQPKNAKLSTDEEIWGSQRKHIIIHITMALIILVLTLCLIYVLVTRRERKSKPGYSKPITFNSKLYQERPTSAIALGELSNGDVQAL